MADEQDKKDANGQDGVLTIGETKRFLGLAARTVTAKGKELLNKAMSAAENARDPKEKLFWAIESRFADLVQKGIMPDEAETLVMTDVKNKIAEIKIRFSADSERR